MIQYQIYLYNKFFMNYSGILSSQSSSQTKKDKKHRQQTLWTQKQQQTYVQFLRVNHEKMISHEQRKKFRVFKMLSKVLGTRTPIQVKSHHQKLLSKYKTLTNIINQIQLSNKSNQMKLVQKIGNGSVYQSVGIQVDFLQEKLSIQDLNCFQFGSFEIYDPQYYQQELKQWSYGVQEDEFNNYFNSNDLFI